MNALWTKRLGPDSNSVLIVAMTPKTKENYLSAAIFYFIFQKLYYYRYELYIFPTVIPLYNNRI
jgi:hypothetical protein